MPPPRRGLAAFAPRRLTGPTDSVVVVGAGLGGLAAALHLAGAGRQVTVLERAAEPGGRAGLLDVGGHRFDTGPTVLTMPDLLERTFAAVGERLTDWLELMPLDPIYRAHFPDGGTLDLRPGVDPTADEIARVCGTREADGFRRWVQFVSRLYELERDAFIDRNFDSPFQLVTPDLARLVALGGLRRLAGKTQQYLHDPRTQRLFSFQSMYAGLSPYDALAIYAVIAYMDSVAGVWFPRGGMHAVPRALAAAAGKHGVTLRYGTTVEQIEVRGGRAVAARTSDGERYPADVFIVNPDLPVAYRELLPPDLTPRRVLRQRYSPSAFVLLAGSRQRYRGIAHHNLHFGRAWRRTFDEVIRRGELMSDPSLLVTNPTRTDPGLAPPGEQGYYVLAPVPNLDAPLDWSVLASRYRDELVDRLERLGYVGLGESITVEHVTTPADWRRQGMERGTPFAAAHTFAQTGPFRAANVAPKVDGVVFAGSGTVPGVGVPMVLLSGRLAAERVVAASECRSAVALPHSAHAT